MFYLGVSMGSTPAYLIVRCGVPNKIYDYPYPFYSNFDDTYQIFVQL